jgi:hypothetical protein
MSKKKMPDNRKIKDLTEKEFADLIQESVSGNHIEVSGIIVSSQKCNLKEVEATVNRLVDKHRDFLLLRKELKLKTGFQE